MYGNHLIIMQVLAGHISLDDTVDMFDTPWRTLSDIPYASQMTIRMLIEMRSGMMDFLQQDASVQQTYFLSPTTPFDTFGYAHSGKRVFPPGRPVPVAAPGTAT